MNRNDFLNMMEDKVPITRQMVSEVYELIDIFPYFQSAHMLLLKGLQNSSDVKFENQLRISSIYIADREVLYYHLKRKTNPPITSPAGSISDIVQTDEAPVINESIPEEDSSMETVSDNGQTDEVVTQNEIIPQTASSIDPSSDTGQTVIESGKNSRDIISEIEKNSGEGNQEEEQGIHALLSKHSVLIASEADDEEPAAIMMLQDERPAPDDTKVFFMDPGFSVPEQSDLLELDLDLDGNMTENFYEEPEDQVLPVNGEKDSKKLLQSDLIDKFILANPRIEPSRDKTNLPEEDISKPFVEEEGGFITETLAKIYISQGYYSKAIDIFEKLSLKFPEKSSYFVAQIEKVKEYIKK